MNVIQTDLPGVLVIEPDVHGDARGFFMESWNQARFQARGLNMNFVQDNVSASERGVVRGLHFQNPNPQGKLVYVLEGEVLDVAVDIRRGSPTFGKAVTAVLSDHNHHQFYVPEGFAHGFCVTSERALFVYKCTDFYAPEADGCVRWDDPAIGIEWPVAEPKLSQRDRAAPLLADIPESRLPVYQPANR